MNQKEAAPNTDTPRHDEDGQDAGLGQLNAALFAMSDEKEKQNPSDYHNGYQEGGKSGLEGLGIADFVGRFWLVLLLGW